MAKDSKKQERVFLENVKLIFRNFSGKEGKFNSAGDRNFGVLLDTPLARAMEKDGWNVKWLKPRDEGDEEQAFLRVSVSYKVRPPRVVLITSNGRNPLNEDQVEMLDWADIREVDMMINPYNWEIGDKTGIKAYLKSIFVTIEEDPLERKYSVVDEPSDGPPPWDE
jgi:hypothetical protein